MNGDEGSDIGSAEVLKTFCGTVMSSNVLEDHPVLVRELKKLNLKALGMTYDEYLRSRDHTSEIIPIQLEVQLANFIAITKDRLPSEPSDSKDVWMRSLARGVSITWEAHLEVLEDGRVCGSEADLDNGEEHGLDMSVPLDVKVQSHTQRQIDELTEPEFLLGLLQPEPINGVIKYVGTLLAYLPRCRDKLLLTLSVFVTSATSPYNLLEQAYTWWTHPNATREPTLEMSLYLEVLSRVLQTMVDDEFFDPKNRIFSLAMIQSTADRLKVLACILLSTAYCQDLVARVLQQIQIRDSRRPFLPRDYWITANNFPMPTLTPQIALEAFQEDEEEDEHPIRHSRYQAKWYSSPRVRLLNDFPFFFAFSTRLETLQALITADSEKRGFNDFFNRATRHHVVCRREHEFEDGFGALWQIGGGIKGPLSVDYRDIHGMQEAGIDGGGLTKEFLTAVCKQAFHPSFGLFIETPERSLYPNPASSSRTPEKLQQYEFLGRIIAKCIYAGILVDVTFAPFFLLNWVGKSAYLDDLQAMDKDLYTGLIQLKNYTGDVENDLSLDFTVNEQKGSGRKATVNLLPDGSQVPVTRANRLQYIHLICHYKLNARLSKQSKAFVRGMADVLDLRWLGMFNQTEMQALVGGAPVPIDIDDLRRNTVYGGFDEQDPAVRIFWDVVREFDNEERRKLVKFVTSTPRPPLLGFKELNPKFSLRNAGSDVQRLPTASTCVNLLKLPNYTTHEQMRRKLRLSITAEAGFDLS
ncbi:E3 ubiquitin-protein ligase UPL6 [Taphrina deformans PYCC 5710]|uniref:HECT-type E3 ubiquitin transferase n=1 Tax=Taphrina deformans (strain PYCC 5710 / ATCC 11124 / CBS 356.35 / IMI 108563 / JCM 9778 / NBRC 8474) TaxID=1097556 RepID=R4XCI4_TAPDE|nr:E3 ubiquitin-protein ligase UPL6 [Taphrina deformans PYCC 5710]|eukprot:CCG83316.1 E3 ubiquitin-protein ligase UPL6 [Taphrina deformans PYCC 5710]